MKKSSMVSGMNFATEFLNSLYKEVLELGGTEEEIFTALKTGNKTIVEFAKLIVSSVAQPLSGFIPVMGLGWVDPDITEANFYVQIEDTDSRKEYRLFNFEEVLIDESVIARMEKEGFRAATIRELLLWGKDNWDRETSIVALGSHCLNPKHKGLETPVLHRDGRTCKLELEYFRNDWTSDFSFLGVRK